MTACRTRTGPGGWGRDFQHRNLLWRDNEVVAVLGWDRILDLERVAAFMAGYRSEIAIGPAAWEDAVQRLWWKRMTDLWVLAFHYDRGDHACDHLFAPQERLLSW
ncbi:protein kinase family protein [Kitasatospora mediocidica]|uniref:hypothetical protein n=1 Tax=Kitasatospora mediocidica TaxID=58352 RepID=UPI000689D55F|nr:hypothetical protein [Kitasatospora mediocidica]